MFPTETSTSCRGQRKKLYSMDHFSRFCGSLLLQYKCLKDCLFIKDCVFQIVCKPCVHSDSIFCIIIITIVLWLGVIATTTTLTSTKVLFVFCRHCAFVCDSSCSSVCCWLKRHPLIRFRPISVFLLALADLKTRLVVRLRLLLQITSMNPCTHGKAVLIVKEMSAVIN